MKNESILFGLMIIIFMSGNLIAQSISNQVKTSFNSSVVSQVFDLVMKTDLVENEQLTIASLIHQKDSTLHTMLINGDSNDSILVVTRQFDDEIHGLLSMEQQYSLYVSNIKENAGNKYTYSQFAIAMRYKDSLDISSVQESALLAYIDTLKQMKNAHYDATKKSLDTRAYESEHISQILTSAQYGQLLIIKNQSKAEKYAQKDWDELVLRSLDSTFTKVDAMNELYNYYLARQCIYDKYEHDLIQQKAFVRELYYQRPDAIKVLQKARRNPENDTIGGGYNGN